LKIKVGSGLLAINLLTILLIGIIVWLPPGVPQILLALLLVLFFPGYVLMAALFPRKASLDCIERLAFSFAMSIVIVAFIAFILNFTPWGLTLESVLYPLASFVFITSAFAWLRQRHLAGPESRTGLRLRLPALTGTRWDRALSVLLVVSFLAVLGTLAYIGLASRTGEKFTEFYILGPGGEAKGYPEVLAFGEQGELLVDIVNHEDGPVTYLIEISIDGVKIGEIGPVQVQHNEKLETAVNFAPDRVGDNQKVVFALYKQGQTEVYKELYLWVDVVSPF
jgi:uncharacterized membrane protein